MFTIDCRSIYLREFLIEDAERLYSLTCEKNISTFLPDWKTSKEQRSEWLRNFELVENKKFLQAAKNNTIDKHMLKMSIRLKETDEFIGWCCTCIKEELPCPNREINYAVSEEFCNYGYATEAVKGLVHYLFNQTNCDHLIAIAVLENIPSNRVITKSGFKYEKKVVIEEKLYNYYAVSQKDWMKWYVHQ